MSDAHTGLVSSKTSPAPAILVGIDGSESSVKALRHGRRLSEALGTGLEAIAVWQKAHSMYDFYQSESGWTPEKDVEKLLDDAVTAAFGDDRPANLTLTVLQGVPARTLIRYSADAEMLVLGSRGHGGFTGLLIGSVSSACVAHASCPVLIVPNKNQPEIDVERGTTVS
ncbi:nucleotide-binding universal stress UspA family protein [Okibacterium sp. HSC-33S16]|uniref:universal stress protein n=1 Tax=Okibacterium sp. HSC-33S16 TaxID=2910965 RepID=UPI0020A09DFB|nr:universal stress protein [Okibacterium sp. HSC-33S16]MCP2031304.1 nucleotide-binding universal stress UspA family protein [Okibacterium sp. HSC-33S16]